MKNTFDIDPNNLVDEWLRMSQMSRACGQREADARHEHAKAKARQAVCAARIALAIRKNPGKYDLRDKPTKEEIEYALELQKEYQETVDEVNTTKRDLDYMTADTVAAIDMRKALENLVQLISIEYYSEKEPQTHSQAARETIESRRRRAVREVPAHDDHS